jgi:vancomycin resistance protein YoaR
VEATLAVIKEGVIAGEHEIALDMEYTQPEVGDDATGESLGITELVSSHTTYFYGSSASRRQNIATAASRFYGVLVAPGEIFSMAKILGDVSLDTGYEEAWIIFGDRTIKGVGGGVCQVSTTLFRTAFFGGYPILERYPHAYRVYYYERTYGGGSDPKWAGLDATVYVPLVDFKFQNDTDYWLLMETYVGDTYLTWKFYSTSDGRTVEWNTTGLTNIQDPPDPLYQENSDLAKGQIEQVDWAVEGADVTVTREVWRDGSVILNDVFSTHYMPWRAVCEYGPGTSGMPPENPSKSNPCKPDKPNND